jgi:hypothetical protein
MSITSLPPHGLYYLYGPVHPSLHLGYIEYTFGLNPLEIQLDDNDMIMPTKEHGYKCYTEFQLPDAIIKDNITDITMKELKSNSIFRINGQITQKEIRKNILYSDFKECVKSNYRIIYCYHLPIIKNPSNDLGMKIKEDYVLIHPINEIHPNTNNTSEYYIESFDNLGWRKENNEFNIAYTYIILHNDLTSTLCDDFSLRISNYQLNNEIITSYNLAEYLLYIHSYIKSFDLIILANELIKEFLEEKILIENIDKDKLNQVLSFLRYAFANVGSCEEADDVSSFCNILRKYL